MLSTIWMIIKILLGILVIIILSGVILLTFEALLDELFHKD